MTNPNPTLTKTYGQIAYEKYTAIFGRDGEGPNSYTAWDDAWPSTKEAWEEIGKAVADATIEVVVHQILRI